MASMLWTYRYRHPVSRTDLVLDCAADTREAALKSARRFIDRLNRRLLRAGLTIKARSPASTWDMHPELPRLPIIAEVR